MLTEITQQEIHTVGLRLPKGELRDWCELCGVENSTTVVYADSEMLSKCKGAMGELQEDDEII